MNPRARLQHAPLLGFFALTFAWSWVCWALSPAIRPQLPWLATLLMFAGSFGPSLAAIVVVASTRPVGGVRAWFVGADPILTHPADSILTRGWMPTA